jgi:nicotinamidase/pyrazinamidase
MIAFNKKKIFMSAIITSLLAIMPIDAQNDFTKAFVDKQITKGNTAYEKKLPSAIKLPFGKAGLDVGNSDYVYVKKVDEATTKLHKDGYFVLASQDFHPANHASFVTNHSGTIALQSIDLKKDGVVYKQGQTLWPDHAIQNTEGVQLFLSNNYDAIVQKGQNPDHDSYSAFADDGGAETSANGILRSRGIKHVIFYGLATDYCVKFSALDAVKRGYKAYFVKDLSLATNPAGEKAAYDEMTKEGVILFDNIEDAVKAAHLGIEKEVISDASAALASVVSLALFDNNNLRILELSSADGFSSGDNGTKYGAWIRAKGIRGKRELPQDSINDFGYSGFDISGGFDFELSNGLVGASFSHSNLELSYKSVEVNNDIPYYSNIISLYGSYNIKSSLSIDGQLGYGFGSLKIDQEKEQKSSLIIGDVSLRYSIDMNNNFKIMPNISVSGSNQSIASALSSSDVKSSELFGNIGVAISGSFASNGDEFKLKPLLFVKSGYDFLADKDSESKIKLRTGGEFGIETSRALYAIGLNSEITKEILVNAGYVKVKVNF